jgi:hypothetical protein
MTVQEPDPVDPLTAVRAAMVLLADLHDRLAHPDDVDDDRDLLLRITALHGAFRRWRHQLEAFGTEGT